MESRPCCFGPVHTDDNVDRIGNKVDCRIPVVADLLPKPATKFTISAIVDFAANLLPVSATVDFVASVPGLRVGSKFTQHGVYREIPGGLVHHCNCVTSRGNQTLMCLETVRVHSRQLHIAYWHQRSAISNVLTHLEQHQHIIRKQQLEQLPLYSVTQ